MAIKTKHSTACLSPPKSIEGPFHIFQHENGTFELISFKNEDIISFQTIPDFNTNDVTFDNLGRAHVVTPHTGPAFLYVRSSSTIIHLCLPTLPTSMKF